MAGTGSSASNEPRQGGAPSGEPPRGREQATFPARDPGRPRSYSQSPDEQGVIRNPYLGDHRIGRFVRLLDATAEARVKPEGLPGYSIMPTFLRV